VQSILNDISKFNEGVQAAIFRQNRLAPTFSEQDITKPFPFNAYYSETEAPVVNLASYKLELSG
jgi:hypothetical protein